MKKLKCSDASIHLKNSFTLHIDSECDSNSQHREMLLTIENKINAAEMQVQIVSLPGNCNADIPMAVVCRNADHAARLIKQFDLSDKPVFWLQENPRDEVPILIGKDHWFIDWSNDNALLPISSLLVRHIGVHDAKRHSEQKLALLNECLGEYSVTLSKDGKVTELNPELSALLGKASETAIGQDLLACLQIPSVIAKTRMQNIVSDLQHSHAMTRLPPFPIQFTNKVIMMDGFVGQLQNQETLLILRQVGKWKTKDWIEQVAVNNAPVTLLLINPDEFAKFNQQYGSDVGDQVLDEIIQSMSDLLRTADFASRYSGAVFAAHLPETDLKQGQALATRMQRMLGEKLFSNKKVNLSFSFGLATLDSEEQLGEQSPLELFRRANTALQAARTIGGGKLVSWQPQFDTNIIANLDRMSGKFSAAPEDDFTLITLQWDLIRVIGNTHSLHAFADQVCLTLSSGMHCNYAGLYLARKDGFTISSCRSYTQSFDVKSVHAWVATNVQVDNLKYSIETPLMPNELFRQAIVPLITRNQCVGMILLRWPLSEKNSVSKYSEQLQHVTPNLAAAIDRILLLENDKRRQEMANKDLGGHHELLFESTAMHGVMQQIQLVAPTDASVLIFGESGTGKEIIARQIHSRSLLAEKPFVTVDCSTIVEHLIESELFGHRKGAFTSATSDQPGLIAQADGGTLFLDEVGELPLDIQSKLLRFVQEKTFVAVGDQRVRKVDVRLVLATNRNLLDEVAMGRFRSDLYYRINVFSITLPALYKRGDDALLLCRHFLAKFAQQYKKVIVEFTPSAILTIQHYLWPGNVRELRNCIMRAVILCEGQLIESEHLNLPAQLKSGKLTKHASSVNHVHNTDTRNADIQKFSKIQNLLDKLVETALQQSRLFPVSAWLELQWLQVCVAKWSSFYQVAHQLELSESTLRRRFAKFTEMNLESAQLVALESECASVFEELLDAGDNSILWSKIECTLHETVMKQDISQKQKATLLNVTQPTLRKIMQQVRR